jgi:predicted metal-dependent hydrolase
MTALRQISNTPQGVAIKPRTPAFNLEAALANDWLGNDPFMTAVFNAMSLSFPTGEKEFIDSVRVYEDRITDEKLLKEIRGFYQQEGFHSREHRKYNKLLCEKRGYDLQELEGVYIKSVVESRENSKVTPRVMLASTVAMEHFTAAFGENVLTGQLLGKVEGPIAELWQWHSMEELEHKSIAFDVYTQIGGSYQLRVTLLRVGLWMFFRNTMKVAFKMLRKDKQLWKWKTFKSVGKFLFAKNGFIRMHVPAYKDFLREDFHPWDVDNRALLRQWQEKLELTAVAA